MPAPSAAGTHAIVLAGGTGSRMPPLSQHMPKALLPLGNQPMLYYPLLSLARSGFVRATILTTQENAADIDAFLNEFEQDKRVQGCVMTCDVCITEDGSGTADAIRNVRIDLDETLVISSDTLCTMDICALLDEHRKNQATCTVSLHVEKPPPAPQPSKKASKSSKPSKKPASTFSPTHYAILTSSGQLLALQTPSDLSANTLTIPPSLIQYKDLQLRSDLSDPHIYVFNTRVMQRVLKEYSAISSVKYDLVPYLARRQRVLSRRITEEGWTLPVDEVKVVAHLVEGGHAIRANTVPTFVSTNLSIAAGAFKDWLDPSLKQPEPVKKGKKTPKEKTSPFAQTGERASASPDSLIGANVTAGAKTSVKKSVVGSNVILGDTVKLNGCVVMNDVQIEDAANLTGCIVCRSVKIGKGAVLKDCRILRNIEEGEEAEGRDIMPGDDEMNGDDAFEFY